MTADSPIQAKVFKARAVLVGERIDLKAWSTAHSLASNPLTVEVKGQGVATLYRYGVVVFFNVLPAEETSFLAQLRPAVSKPYATPEFEELEVHIEPGSPESV